MTGAMQGSFLAINVKPEHRERFLEASILKAQSVISEEQSVFQFQMLTDAKNPNRFYFYAVFANEAARTDHGNAQAFQEWWKAIEPMLHRDIETIAMMHPVFPTKKGFEAQRPGLLSW